MRAVWVDEALMDATCPVCDVSFARRSKTHTFCSNRCQLKNWRLNNPERARENQRRGEAKRDRSTEEHYRRYGRRWAIRRKYGLTEDEYDAMLAKGCAICGEAGKVIDHDHQTGAIRGCLCHHCNAGLGYFRDDKSRLATAIAYLEESCARSG